MMMVLEPSGNEWQTNIFSGFITRWLKSWSTRNPGIFQRFRSTSFAVTAWQLVLEVNVRKTMSVQWYTLLVTLFKIGKSALSAYLRVIFFIHRCSNEVSRTFSKTWGFPSLRLGYLLSTGSNVSALTCVRGPYETWPIAIHCFVGLVGNQNGRDVRHTPW